MKPITVPRSTCETGKGLKNAQDDKTRNLSSYPRILRFNPNFKDMCPTNAQLVLDKKSTLKSCCYKSGIAYKANCDTMLAKRQNLDVVNEKNGSTPVNDKHHL